MSLGSSPNRYGSKRIAMLTQMGQILAQGLHMVGLLIILWGVFLLVGAIFAGLGPVSFVKGGGLMVAGNWIASLAN